ncbi:S46 family peptidase [Salisaeta longa]|uniref:S46 family peptidase n=1 Tax=Salisaeta longa TaxID=503170 RepID=UPI0003B76F8F|nr:S46 family peptidase [Salisaeta longa]
MIQSTSVRLGAALLTAWLLVLGCGPSRETVVVTQRPEPIPSTETPADRTAEPGLQVPAPYDTVKARRFDRGRMWTFDTPPVDYLKARYRLTADSAWLAEARLGALRFGNGCTASFVSAHGLVMTNHHCARESIAKVSRGDEQLLQNGFFAATLAQERTVPDLHVEQLVALEDVTERVLDRVAGTPGSESWAQNRDQRMQQVQEQMTVKVKERDEQLRVELVSFYGGLRISAYTYRRYEDVRLVMAPSIQLGFFGGAPDNFTYPRYALDMSFFRVYTKDGEPLSNRHYFEWATEGAAPGDAVFVVGNPGGTQRLNTVAQLKYLRDHDLPGQLDVLSTRDSLLQAYLRQYPDSARAYDLQNTYFSINNSIKSLSGQLRGLRDPYLIARRAAAEQQLRDSIQASDSLQTLTDNAIQQIQQLQQSKAILADKAAAFVAFGSTELGSRVLSRAVYGYFYDLLKRRGARPERLQDLRKEALSIDDWPLAVERDFIEARLLELKRAYGANDPTIRRLLAERSAADIAETLVQKSALVDSARYAKILDKSFLSSKDPAVQVMEAVAPLYQNVSQQLRGYNSVEEGLNAKLNRARFAAFGHELPPDATFTLRLSDGVVQAYPYNGTRAPAFTNFYGLLDHYYSYPSAAWTLPKAWLDPPAAFNLETPYNLVSTNDITGGNSGSPLLNKDLEVVGLIFDGNIESLPNEYLYTNATARAVSVDVRGMLEVLRDFYGYERLAQELTRGRLVRGTAAAR